MNRKQRRADSKAPQPSEPASLQDVFIVALQLHQAGRMNEAEILYRKILAVDSRHADSLHQLGVMAYQLGQPAVAVDFIQNAIDVQPLSASYHSDLGIMLQAVGRLDDAIAAYHRALQRDASLVEAHNNLGNALKEAGRVEEAVASYRRALELRPGYAEAENNLGNAMKDLGRYDEALRHYASAHEMMPRSAAVLSNLGTAYQHLGRFDEAERCYHQALEIDPHYAEAHNNLGHVHVQTDRLAAAVASYRTVLRLRPDAAQVHFNLATVLQKMGHLPDAVVSYREAIAQNASLAEAHNNMGTALQDLGQVALSEECYRRAIALSPPYAEAHNNLANALKDQMRLDEAITCFTDALRLRPDYAEAHSNCANVLTMLDREAEAVEQFLCAIALQPGACFGYNNLGIVLQGKDRQQEAIGCYGRASLLDPTYPDAQKNLGIVLTEIGQLDEAFIAAAKAVELAPRRADFYRALANTGRVTADSVYLQRMQALASEVDTLPETQQMELHFALGKVYEVCGQPEASFRHLLLANAIKRRSFEYDEAESLALFDHVRRVFTPSLLADHPDRGCPSDLPIFVVGMPRSGTTLVEQILASHPQVFGAGELLDLRLLIEALDSELEGVCFPDSMAVVPHERLRRLGEDYVAGLRRRAPDSPRVVDKLPGNFMLVGAIRLALPKAHIIHIRRDPVDTCFSCFSQLFTGLLPYAYDLGELGRYYSGYARLTRYWQEALPAGAMLDVDYEALVADLPGQARRILDYCDLPWDDRCLSFHQTKRPIRTASAGQVRQPIYAKSVGRWHVYGDLARPLLDALTA